MFRKFLKLLIILAISILIGNMAYGMYQEFELSNGPSAGAELNDIYLNSEIELNELADNSTNETADNEGAKLNRAFEKIDEEYKGYKVSAKLIIPKIELNTYVLEKYGTDTMELCPTKYFGAEPNEAGNFCIAAHNYNKENMFNHIIELEKGDTIILIDNKNGEVKYEVYDVYKVKPNETEPLSQKTEGRTELTLITCSDYSSKRIIVKARKV